ncbi:MAG TPA: FkbM family methyltransferase [Tepidisphaeraceae bacterium]|nr:FkbM family methyltransferase [Tepidisphaeraceae bacterium]
MPQRVKSLVKHVLKSAGYDVRRRENAIFPYARRIDLAGHQFDFWIADVWGRLWYEEAIDDVRREAEQLQLLVRPGDRILEIGCHHGFFTAMLAQAVSPAGFVCAVEASPENAMVAQAQITLNHLGGRATVLHAAGSDCPGSLSVQSNNGGGNNHIVLEDQLKSLEVEAVTGDELDAKYGPFNLIKLDVEGFEAKVLMGCTRILARRPRIAIEVHCAELPRYGSSVIELMKLLNASEYQGFVVKRPAYTLEPFAQENIGGDEPVNLFLRPRSNES